LIQKLSIRFKSKFKDGGELIQLESGKLFSKFFAESNKLVMKQFEEIHSLLRNKQRFIVLLMDEVESLTASRQNSMAGGGEPMDAIRVVNCILGEIDKLKQFSNVLVLATSNVTKVIDDAFLDRSDLCLLIDIPTQKAIYVILRNGFIELLQVGIIVDTVMPVDVEELEFTECVSSKLLWEISVRCSGSSGRKLNRILFVVHALYIKSVGVSLEYYLNCLKVYVHSKDFGIE
jgi:SpoVK/Ycf46/Vps4 family AAA+-type ATPase